MFPRGGNCLDVRIVKAQCEGLTPFQLTVWRHWGFDRVREGILFPCDRRRPRQDRLEGFVLKSIEGTKKRLCAAGGTK